VGDNAMQAILEQKDINSEELHALLQARAEGKADFVLVDVRENMEYNTGHIKGADMLKPTSSFNQWGQELFNELKDKTIVFTVQEVEADRFKMFLDKMDTSTYLIILAVLLLIVVN